MELFFRRSYRGPLRGVILDWAGTTVDYGCFAPTLVFLDIFKRFGVEITLEEARAPMGGHKRDHIEEITQIGAVRSRWVAAHGVEPGREDVDRMFAEFVPAQVAVIARHADIIPGCLEACADFRKRGLKIGTTTGYTGEMTAPLVEAAAKNGYSPDCTVCASDVPAGRPAPWMCFENARRLGVYPMEALVKIGDTVPDIAEGLNAGMWTIGTAVTGNEMGLTGAEVKALAPAEFQARRGRAAAKLAQSGAHYVVDGIGEVPAVLDEIARRVAAGEKP